MELIDPGSRVTQVLVGLTAMALAVMTSGHALLYKRDTRAALLWAGCIWLLPLVGPLLYLLLGINRIRRHALDLRGDLERHVAFPKTASIPPPHVSHALLPHAGHLGDLARLLEQVLSRPLLPGNRIEPLQNGDQAYPAMLDAIASARESLTLSTYLFGNDTVGCEFVEALAAAVRRAVQVRVLVDDMGAHYSWPSIIPELQRRGVTTARFLPPLIPWKPTTLNLRNHRKILVADGRVGFTGGLNLQARNRLKNQPAHPVQDLHFRLAGPVVAQLQEAFADDWAFCTGERLQGRPWFSSLENAGSVMARGIADGPDEDFEKLRWTLLGALACAQSSVRVLTPYFLPDPALISALNLAAMRGVAVDILLPSHNNLPVVHWATTALLWQVLERGCRIWLTPPPFDHSKLMLVDGSWALIGSANWDPRSLRLNFEFNVECYDAALARRLEAILQTKLEHARPVTLDDVDRRPLPVRLRDSLARLLTPFL